MVYLILSTLICMVFFNKELKPFLLGFNWIDSVVLAVIIESYDTAINKPNENENRNATVQPIAIIVQQDPRHSVNDKPPSYEEVMKAYA